MGKGQRVRGGYSDRSLSSRPGQPRKRAEEPQEVGGAWLLLGCGDQSRIRCLGLEPSLALALPPGREEEVVPPAGWQGG